MFISSATSWTRQAKLTASDGASGDEFGFSVAVSGDADVDGSPESKIANLIAATPGAGGLGGAYVFAFSGSSWSQQAELASSDGGGDFGYSVAVERDHGDCSGKLQQFVFDRSGLRVGAFGLKNWTQQAKLLASDRVAGNGITAAAVSGNSALFGAPGKNGGQGEAYVFVQTGTNWTQQAELKASGATSADSFGSAICRERRHGVGGVPYQGFQSRRGLRFCAFGFRRNLEPAGQIDGSRRSQLRPDRFHSAATPLSSVPPTVPTSLCDREPAGRSRRNWLAPTQ